jgi:predicted DNA-binding transcriptional regulator
MGEASRRKKAGVTLDNDRAATLRTQFAQMGVNPDDVGFYDTPAFMAAERQNPRVLERYGEWVVRRQRDMDYDTRVRAVVPRLAEILEAHLVEHGWLGDCFATAIR